MLRSNKNIIRHGKHNVQHTYTELDSLETPKQNQLFKGSLVRNFRSYKQLDSLVKW